MPVVPLPESNEPVSLGPVLDFMRRLWALDHALQSISKRMESSLGLTGPQRLVIRIVGRYPGISAGRLAEILHVHPSTLTGVLGRLEERSLVTRKVDKMDLRRALFQLTARGRALDVPNPGTVEAAIEAALAKLPARNIQIAEQLLAHVATELGREAEVETAASKPARTPRPAKAPAPAKAPKPARAAKPGRMAAASATAKPARATARPAAAKATAPKSRTRTAK